MALHVGKYYVNGKMVTSQTSQAPQALAGGETPLLLRGRYEAETVVPWGEGEGSLPILEDHSIY